MIKLRALVEVKKDHNPLSGLDIPQAFCISRLDLQGSLHLGQAPVPG
jgi:hypothetical protein